LLASAGKKMNGNKEYREKNLTEKEKQQVAALRGRAKGGSVIEQ